jgi:hypothetical protein
MICRRIYLMEAGKFSLFTINKMIKFRCFAFKPDEDNLFLIGTDGGEVGGNCR